MLPLAHLRLSQALFEAGDWDEALVHAHVVLSLAPDQEASWIETEVSGKAFGPLRPRSGEFGGKASGSGRLLHARGDRRGAVDELRAAHELLAGVGAAPYLARVEADLAAAGMPGAVPRQAQRQASSLALTDREGDVVALAKLGISSRRELRKFAR